MNRERTARKPGSTAKRTSDESFARNQDFALLALLLCGGGEGAAHIEDVALKAHELAPTRFKWERHDYPSLDTARVALRADRGPDDLVQRIGSKFYSLTSDGILRAIRVGNHVLGTDHADPLAVIHEFNVGLLTSTEPIAETGIARNRPAQKPLRRIKNHETFRAWRKDATTPFELWQLAELLECMPDASTATWEARLQNLKRQATFWQDQEVRRFAEIIGAAIRLALATERKGHG